MITTPCRSGGLRTCPGLSLWRLAAGLACLAAPLAAAATEPETVATPAGQPSLVDRYYRSREQLGAEQAGLLAPYCDGGYVRPALPSPPQAPIALLPGDEPIYAEAREGVLILDQQAILEGNVRITQGDRRLLTPRAEVDLNTREVTLSEGLELQDPQAVVQGETGAADTRAGSATLANVEYLLFGPSFRGTASRLDRAGNGDLHIEDGSFTRCEPGSRAWRVSARQIDIPEDGVFGTARHAVLRVRDVPVLYTPYISFPVSDERLSGFLFPAFGYSGEDGFELSLPYYLNLAPNYDATLVPRYFSKRGTGLEAEFRYLNDWQNSTLTGAFLPDDDLYDGTYDRKDFRELFPGQPFESEDRWLVGLQHQGRLDGLAGLRTVVDYTAVSDRDYFRDLGNDLGVASRIELERRGELIYEREDLLVRLWAQRFQRLDEIRVDPYERLPQLELAYRGDLPGPLQWNLGTQWARFDRDVADLSGRDAITGDRFHLEPRLSLPLSWPFGYLNASGGLRYTRYDLDAAGRPGLAVDYDESRSRSIGFGSLSGGLVFERDLSWFSTPLIQTLEPQVYYLYQGFEDQSELPVFDTTELTFGYRSLFRDNRFSGVDRFGDANQLTLGVTSRFLDRGNGRELLRASVGQIFYFRDRRVTLSGAQRDEERQSSSAMAGEVSARVARYWSANGSLIWDPNDNQVDEATVSLQYKSDARRIFNVGYRHRGISDIDQSDISLYWPISRRVAVLARWNYDLDSERTIEGFGGLEYNNCCWRIRLLARRFIDSPSSQNFENLDADEGIFLQIIFKGLAGVGGQVESVLERGIKGYQPEIY